MGWQISVWQMSEKKVLANVTKIPWQMSQKMGWQMSGWQVYQHPEAHRIPFEGLLLLEEVESAFDSTVLRIEKLYSYGETKWDDALWSALSARMLRYQETMTKVWIGEFEIADLRTMKAFRTVLQFCPAMGTYLEAITVDLDNLAMVQEFRNLLLFCPHPRGDLDLIVSGGDIGNGGWALLAKAVRLRPGFVEWIR